MEMDRNDLLAIGVAVGRGPHAEANQGHYLVGTDLMSTLGQVNAGPSQVENEVLALVLGQKRDRHSPTAPRVGPRPKIHASLGERDKMVGFNLSQVCIGH